MTTAFVDGAEIMARACGLPGYRFAIIDHPVASATDEELRQRAVDLVAQACQLLLDGATPPPSAEG